jgi:hypothetical protein
MSNEKRNSKSNSKSTEKILEKLIQIKLHKEGTPSLEDNLTAINDGRLPDLSNPEQLREQTEELMRINQLLLAKLSLLDLRSNEGLTQEEKTFKEICGTEEPKFNNDEMTNVWNYTQNFKNNDLTSKLLPLIEVAFNVLARQENPESLNKALHELQQEGEQTYPDAIGVINYLSAFCKSRGKQIKASDSKGEEDHFFEFLSARR